MASQDRATLACLVVGMSVENGLGSLFGVSKVSVVRGSGGVLVAFGC